MRHKSLLLLLLLLLSLNSCLIGLDQLYTGHPGGSSREKALNKILSTSSLCVSHGVVVRRRPGVQTVPSLISGRTCFCFFVSSFFFFSFTFSLLFSCCSFVFFLYIAYKSYASLPYFPFNFLPFSRSPSRCPAIHVFLANVVFSVVTEKSC